MKTWKDWEKKFHGWEFDGLSALEAKRQENQMGNPVKLVHTVCRHQKLVHTVAHRCAGHQKRCAIAHARRKRGTVTSWQGEENWFSRVRKLAWRAATHVPFSSFNAWHGELLPTYQHQCAPALKVQEGSHCFLVDLQNSQQTTTNSGEFTKKCMYVTPQTNK